MVTLKFLRDVFSGRKKLLRKELVKGTSKIPRYPEINVQSLWAEVRMLDDICVYFPDACVLRRQIPDRNFLMTVN